MFVTLAALVSPLHDPASAVQLWPLNHDALWACGFCFPCLTSTSQTLITAISLRPDGGWVSAKGFLPQAGTANKEFLKNCPIIIKQFLFFHNIVKLPSSSALAFGEAACVTSKKPLTHLSWESVFSELLRFGVSLISQVRPGNVWDFSSGGHLCSVAQHGMLRWAPHHYHTPLHLYSEYELLPSDSSLSGNASSCPCSW